MFDMVGNDEQVRDELEQILCVARSANRLRLLNELREHQSLTRDELESRTDVARTTLLRNIDKLSAHGWIEHEKKMRVYSITPKGRVVADQFSELIDTLKVADELAPVFRYISELGAELDYRSLLDADIYTPKPGDPWAMVHQHAKRLDESTHIRVLLPIAGLRPFEVLHERVTKREATYEAIVSPEVLQIYFSDIDYRSIFVELIENDRCEFYESTKEIPFYLGLLDEIVQLGIDENGTPKALAEIDNERVRDWAEAIFQEYKNQATEVEYSP